VKIVSASRGPGPGRKLPRGPQEASPGAPRLPGRGRRAGRGRLGGRRGASPGCHVAPPRRHVCGRSLRPSPCPSRRCAAGAGWALPPPPLRASLASCWRHRGRGEERERFRAWGGTLPPECAPSLPVLAPCPHAGYPFPLSFPRGRAVQYCWSLGTPPPVASQAFLCPPLHRGGLSRCCC